MKMYGARKLDNRFKPTWAYRGFLIVKNVKAKWHLAFEFGIANEDLTAIIYQMGACRSLPDAKAAIDLHADRMDMEAARCVK